MYNLFSCLFGHLKVKDKHDFINKTNAWLQKLENMLPTKYIQVLAKRNQSLSYRRHFVE